MIKRLYQKSLKLAAHKSSKTYLGMISFIESYFFDALLIQHFSVIWKKQKKISRVATSKRFIDASAVAWARISITLCAITRYYTEHKNLLCIRLDILRFWAQQ